jgi:hypothetical protein
MPSDHRPAASSTTRCVRCAAAASNYDSIIEIDSILSDVSCAPTICQRTVATSIPTIIAADIDVEHISRITLENDRDKTAEPTLSSVSSNLPPLSAPQIKP